MPFESLDLYLLVSIVVFFTAMISAIAGFGSGMIIVLFFSFFYDIKTAIALGSIIFLFTNINKTLLFYKTVDWYFVKIMYITLIPATFLGLYFFNIIDPWFIEYFLGLFGLWMIIDHIFSLRKTKTLKKFSVPKILVGGAVMGFFAGLASSGFIKVMLLQFRGLSKEFFVGTGVILTFGINIIKSAGYMHYDLLHISEFVYFLPLFFINLGGTFFGKKIVKNISKKMFENIVITLVCIMVLKFFSIFEYMYTFYTSFSA